MLSKPCDKLQMLWIVFAVQLTTAQPVNAAQWFIEVPWEKLLAKRDHALNLARITVGPDGKVNDCRIEATSGIPQLDQQTCAAIIKRARFQPARLADGKPIHSVYRRDFLWAAEDRFQYDRPVDIEIVLSRLPARVTPTMMFSIPFVVDPTGNKSSCEPPKQMNKALASIACQQIVDDYPVVPAHDARGASVSSIQNARVRFVTN